MSFIKSRKWMIGTLYIVGVFACDLLKTPLSPEAIMWTGLVVTTLIGGQTALDHKNTVPGGPKP